MNYLELLAVFYKHTKSFCILVSGSFLNSEGSALYELQSMANHSCIPNSEIEYKNNNNILSIVALNDIKPGQEVTISYLDECDLRRTRHSRQKILKYWRKIYTCILCIGRQ